MNFASLMSAQIAKTETKSAPSNDSKSRFLRRSEIESNREKAYLAEQTAREAERLSKAEKKRQLEDEESEKNKAREAKRQRLAEESRKRRIEEAAKEEGERRKRLGLPELPTQDEPKSGDDKRESSAVPETEDVPDEELFSKLRNLSEPAKLFGETHKQRLKRYRKLQANRSATTNGSKAASQNRSNGPITTNLDPLPEAEIKVDAKIPDASNKDARLYLARQLTSWFSLVLKEWAIALGGRTEDVKRSLSGQAATNSMTQAVAHLKPLYRKLEKLPNSPSELPDDLLAPIAEIVCAAQERRYVDANDGYLKLSIGKAAWPIGVTMVGIHERSAREKLHESDKGKAHIMADETTRKFLQSIKRCLSFAQTRWPPEDVGQLMG